jgi:tetratricopeptide (TPR) repeat protein
MFKDNASNWFDQDQPQDRTANFPKPDCPGDKTVNSIENHSSMSNLQKKLDNILLLTGSFNFAIGFVVFSLSLSIVIAGLYLTTAISKDSCEKSQILYERGQYKEAMQTASLAAMTNPFSSEAAFQEGQIYAKRLMYKEAVKHFNRSLLLAPNNIKALDARSVACLRTNQAQQTILDIEKIREIAPRSIKPYQIGNLAIAQYQTGKYKDALVNYRRASTMGGLNRGLLIGQICCLNYLGESEKSLKLCQTALETYKDDSELLCQRGYCYFVNHDNRQALKDFNKAIRLNPSDSRWYRYRADFYLGLNNPQALKDSIKAAKLNPIDHTLIYSAAKTANHFGDYDNAFHFYKDLSVTPEFKKDKKIQLEYADLCYKLTKYEEAAGVYTLALERERNGDVLIKMAQCQTKLSNNKEARKLLDEAEQNRHSQPAFLLAKAQLSKQTNDLISAIDYYSRLLAIAPNQKEAWRERGECYLAKGQLASASADFAKAVKYGDYDPQLLLSLQQCQRKLHKFAMITNKKDIAPTINLKKYNNSELLSYGYKESMRGNCQLAIVIFQEAIRREPSNILPRRYLAHCLKNAGLYSEATTAFYTLGTMENLNKSDKLNYAESLAILGNYPEAISMLQSIHMADPGDSEVTFQLAKILSASGAKEEAIKLCQANLGNNNGSKQLTGLYNSLVSPKQGSVGNGKENLAKPDTEG